jgi:hypothetical protein
LVAHPHPQRGARSTTRSCKRLPRPFFALGYASVRQFSRSRAIGRDVRQRRLRRNGAHWRPSRAKGRYGALPVVLAGFSVRLVFVRPRVAPPSPRNGSSKPDLPLRALAIRRSPRTRS